MVKLGGTAATRPNPEYNSKQEEMQAKTQDAAKMYEKLFLREMVKAMRQTVPDGGLLKKNQAEEIFQQQLDGEYVETWGDKGGIGLADVIYQQIVDRFGAQMGLKAKSARPQGPLAIKPSAVESEAFKAQNFMNGNRSSLGMHLKNLSELVGETTVTSPWAGVLVNSQILEGGQVLDTVEHENGLFSKMFYQGKSVLGIGDKVESGDKIGQLKDLNGEFVWQLEAKVDKNVSL